MCVLRECGAVMVKTICYGHEDTWEDRELAIRQFMEWACGSEGSEREIY